MILGNLLIEKRSELIKKWQGVIIGSYPTDTQRFLKREKSRFANPIGHIIQKEIATLYDELVKGEDLGKIEVALDNIIRPRAVQDFKPSHAIAFVLALKKLVREELEGNPMENGLPEELFAFETRVDDVALLAFDIFSQCRQKIYEIRVKEAKNQVGRLLERANLICEIPETGGDL